MDAKPVRKSGLSWAGPLENKAIEDMTREELIAAVIDLIGQQRRYQSSVHSRAYGLGMVEMIKRGENTRLEGDDAA